MPIHIHWKHVCTCIHTFVLLYKYIYIYICIYIYTVCIYYCSPLISIDSDRLAASTLSCICRSFVLSCRLERFVALSFNCICRSFVRSCHQRFGSSGSQMGPGTTFPGPPAVQLALERRPGALGRPVSSVTSRYVTLRYVTLRYGTTEMLPLNRRFGSSGSQIGPETAF